MVAMAIETICSIAMEFLDVIQILIPKFLYLVKRKYFTFLIKVLFHV